MDINVLLHHSGSCVAWWLLAGRCVCDKGSSSVININSAITCTAVKLLSLHLVDLWPPVILLRFSQQRHIPSSPPLGVVSPLQVHHPLRPAGPHAGGRTGGAGAQHQEPAGLLHGDQGGDSPLNPHTHPPSRTHPPLFDALNVPSSLLGPHPAGPCASCVSKKKQKTISILQKASWWETERREERTPTCCCYMEDAWRVPRHQCQPADQNLGNCVKQPVALCDTEGMARRGSATSLLMQRGRHRGHRGRRGQS